MGTLLPTPDVRLLTLLVKPTQSAGDREQAALLATSCDWAHVVRLAATHGVDGQLYRRVVSDPRVEVPEKVMSAMQSRATFRSMRNLQQTAELVRVVKLLTAAQLDVMPFKGAALADRLYGDVALRTFCDLDILVRRSDFHSVKSLLVANGFTDARGLEGAQEKYFLDSQMGYEFVHNERDVVVEVHWAFINRVHSLNLPADEIWSRARPRVFAGLTVPAMSSEDLLLYLCAHGSKSFWERLGWICDVAALLESDEDLDWDLVLGKSAEWHAETILFLGLRLATELCGTPLPDRVQRRVVVDNASKRLQEKVSAWIWAEVRPAITERQKISFHMQMRERIADRVPYFRHIVRITMESRFRRLSSAE